MNKMALIFGLILTTAASFTWGRVIANIPNTTTMPPHIHLQPIQVKSHKVNTVIKNGVAVTTLESVFYNPNHRVLEGTYLFALPKNASIAQFSLWIDGKEMPAELLDAEKARNLYISIVQRMIDPALLEFVGRETFKMRIFPLPANGERKIKLSYQQVLPADGNLMRYDYPLTAVGNSHEDYIGEFSMNIDISSQIPIKSIFSPTHKVKVEKEDKSAKITFSGNNIATSKDLVLYISNSNKKVDLSFIPFRKEGKKGYFLMMISPKTKVDASDINAKDIVFILDTSGSMVGDSMEQAKNALKYCLHQLPSKDRFNIIPFSTEASPYKDNLIDASKGNIKNALEYVEEEIYARGGTNIDEALEYAIKMAPKNSDRPYMVVLLTDGKPTIGITDPQEITTKVKKAAVSNMRLFTFGIGDRLNTKLLDRLAEENKGIREYVNAKEDIEIKISSFVDKFSSPVLSNIEIDFPSTDSLRVTEVYPRQFPDLFKGGRILLLGRYKGDGDQAIRIKGNLAGKAQQFVYEVSFPKQNTENGDVPRLWAVRKVGFLIDQIRLHGENDELKKEVVRLAKKFGIVTPYTSYLVVEDTPQPVVRPGIPEEPTIWRGVEEESADSAGEAMKEDSGEKAVQASKDLRKMKNTEGFYENDEVEMGKNNDKKRSVMRKIAYKTFYKSGKVWYDSDCTTKSAAKKSEIKIKYMSEAYIKLITDNPELAKFLAIGKEIVVMWKDKKYHIHE